MMKYLHRKMEDLNKLPSYNFHSKCENLSLVDLGFADDLLIFFRGDKISV